MFSTVTAGAISGIHSYLIQVEVDVSKGLPAFNIVGLPGAEAKESGQRVKVALKNSGISLPPSHITINLSPADIRKEGVSIDLPVAIGIMLSLGEISDSALDKTLVIGELGLDGEVRKINGVLPIVKCAVESGYTSCILPYENAAEGALAGDIKIIGVKNLIECVSYLKEEKSLRDSLIKPTKVCVSDFFENKANNYNVDFADINGQSALKRAMEVVVAGFHHVLMVGSPGSGKSMIAKRIPTIMPPLEMDEALEVSTIYSVAGMLDSKNPLMIKRPFMSPHHSVTMSALAGGGRIPKPGVISLSHRGVLFLDEIAEFSRSTLDLLRQPLEDKEVHIARVGGSFTYPANFMLVGAMNPCPCGYYPDRGKCRCTDKEIANYLSHISGPILDRIDICVDVPKVDFGDLSAKTSANESSKTIMERVLKARAIQEERFKNSSIRFNSEMSPKDIEKYCKLGTREKAMIEQLFYKMDLSARSYHRILRVARTIADLDGSTDIKEMHIAEAACYKSNAGNYWNNAS